MTGCRREQVAVYESPKEAAPKEVPAAAPHAGMGGMQGMAPHGSQALAEQMPPRPGLKWKKLPPGWTERGASGMRVANFAVTATSELGVIPLPGTGGGDLDLVNLWRGQVGLEPITEDQLKAHTEDTNVAGQAVKLFTIVGSGGTDAAAATNQILVATVRNEGFTWFFKLAGDAASVNANRDALKTFLTGIEFTAPEAPAAAVAAAAPAGAAPFAGGAAPQSGAGPSGGQPKPTWQVPDAWKAATPGQMVHSKWTAADAQGAAVEIAVSVFPGETGGLAANVNRWRAKVALKPAANEEIQALADNLEVAGGKATLTDFTGTDPEGSSALRLLGVIVRRDGWSWFYKMTGAPAAVESQKEAFLRFAKTAQYSRGS